MFNLNVFRVLGDLAHISSKCILIWAIHRNRSAEGVSLLTQMLYAMVFVTRYLDLFRAGGWAIPYNVFFKLFYIASSFYIIYIMMKVFPRTRERERAWKLAMGSVGIAIVLGPILAVLLGNEGWHFHWFTETTVPTVIDSYYLVALGSYRAFYILNWIVRRFGAEDYWDPISIIFGIIQTAFYVDFAWVYYTRQRVKLRNGGVVDSEDFRKSWLVNKVLNFRRRPSTDEEQQLNAEDGEEGASGGGGERPGSNRWGARGISISADDTIDEQHRSKPPHGNSDDDGLGEVLEDEDDYHTANHENGQTQRRDSPPMS
ncbi:hypothetical protein FE257_012623 [Aspergillus nanangensis]|uniref:Protein-ER retention receptor n=1 Tax=Aspergillus nanangensis TaxID=2582783 RepID=A0AAD4CH69_ASPNN|nr:hypothetical protein FE257_012623 [Aspergillus nanangensis]